MGALVIKQWKAEKDAVDGQNHHVSIVGRESGLIAWLLSWMKIDPTTSLLVGPRRVEFKTTSLAGSQSRIVPLENICSSYYGYHKPWKAALGIVTVSCFIGASLSDYDAWPFFTFLMLGTIVALVYYFLNRSLTLGFVEDSGFAVAIRFKRSVIENVDINEDQAKHVCLLTQDLIEAAEKR